MIQEFVDRFLAAKEVTKAVLAQKHPESYDALVTRAVKILADGEYRSPDPERITVIDHGDYQGTRLFIIGANGYQPSTYWSIFVDYGSCSGCDALEDLRGYDSDPPKPHQIDGYWMMMLHMVESMKPLREDQ